MKKKPSKKRIWSTVSRKVICHTPYLDVCRDQVVFPDGRIAPYLVVERHDFAVVIPRFPNGDIVMVRQYRYPLHRNTWEFPMGVVKGVSMLKAAKTELQQETGYVAKKWTFLGKYYVAPGMTGQMGYVYLAEGLVEGTPCPEEWEFVVAKRLPRLKIKQWFDSRRIQDGPTLAAWGMLKSS